MSPKKAWIGKSETSSLVRSLTTDKAMPSVLFEKLDYLTKETMREEFRKLWSRAKDKTCHLINMAKNTTIMNRKEVTHFL